MTQCKRIKSGDVGEFCSWFFKPLGPVGTVVLSASASVFLGWDTTACKMYSTWQNEVHSHAASY